MGWIGGRNPAMHFSRLFQSGSRKVRSLRLSRSQLLMTRTGLGYFAVWLGLLLTGLHQQNNMIFLAAGMAAGPIAASFAMVFFQLRRVAIQRRLPEQIFEGEPLAIDYTVHNQRTLNAVLALEVRDQLDPLDRSIPGAAKVNPRLVFDRVAPSSRSRVRWQAPSPVRGRYRLTSIDLITRAPFGLVERGVTCDAPGSLIVYPRIGVLKRKWSQLLRESTETRRGPRHDRTAQQQEYHGLRDYRSGDSPRWIHWRTSARVGMLMVKEFEQEHDQEIAIVLDAWRPQHRASDEQKEAVEQAIRFAATACLQTCKTAGRRLVLGWTGPTPGIRQGPASMRLLHEILEVLATMEPNRDGLLSSVFDVIPPAVVREAFVVVISTRPVDLAEEARRSARLSQATARGLASRMVVIDVSRGDLNGYVSFDTTPTSSLRPLESTPNSSAHVHILEDPAQPAVHA